MTQVCRNRSRVAQHQDRGRKASRVVRLVWGLAASGALAAGSAGCGSDSSGSPWSPPVDAAADVFQADAAFEAEASVEGGQFEDQATDAPAPEASVEAGTCVPATCSSLGAQCGKAPDGCGGKIDCGACTSGLQCGGAGANKCGSDACAPKTCLQIAAQCGLASDGCADVLDCGGCPAPQACGQGSDLNKCMCLPATCGKIGAECGSAPDGCGGVIECGTCASGKTCGGGGPNKCGTNQCAPKTCPQLKASCGVVSDQCGEALNCGNCSGYDVCGGANVPNQCGCTSKTCAQLGASCGQTQGGCGLLECGDCVLPDSCGGGGVPSQCGCTCTLPHASTSCLAGQCAIGKCDPEWADCDSNPTSGCETNIGESLAACGACGNSCSAANATPLCKAGVCSIGACNAGYADCDGDPSNGCEANLKSDPTHCGACPNVCPSTGGTAVCNAGVCGYSTCPDGKADCDGSSGNGCEVDVTLSTQHCGYCNNPCSFTHATSKCVGAACHINQCQAGYSNCDGNESNGCETATGNSAEHCGSCAHACPAGPNSTASCLAGVCMLSCNGSFGDCDGDAANGCETDLLKQPDHCGTCTTSCSVANGSAGCTNGTCVVASCAGGFGDCDGKASNGCETNTASDEQHCGGCTTVCSQVHGTPDCNGGTCSIACAPGYSDCDGNVGTGCETNTGSDLQNCGSCGGVCTVPNGTPACNAGVCSVSNCAAGMGDCDGNTSNGCEANLNSSLSHCGGCGNGCSAPQAVTTCSGGTCAIASCSSGWSDCNGQIADGCEVHTAVDPSHCGGCTTACSANNGTATCSGGTCGISCNAGWVNCDSNPANGCEAFTASDTGNCGACGNTCSVAHGTGACSAGNCSIASCQSGYGNCDFDYSTGCETTTSSNPSHCGACGAACNSTHGTPSCSSGTCAIGCNSGWGNCDGNVSTGCETPLTTLANCGNCGTSCSFVCSASMSCTGVCSPGSMQCSGTTVQTCNAAGQWENSLSCQYACVAGSCTGTCSPGATQCKVNDLQTCQANGTWDAGTACVLPTPKCEGNKCVCTPTTCAAASAGCGTIPDGCGKTLNCGTCAGSTSCGVTTPNQCGPVFTATCSTCAAGYDTYVALGGTNPTYCGPPGSCGSANLKMCVLSGYNAGAPTCNGTCAAGYHPYSGPASCACTGDFVHCIKD